MKSHKAERLHQDYISGAGCLKAPQGWNGMAKYLPDAGGAGGAGGGHRIEPPWPMVANILRYLILS